MAGSSTLIPPAIFKKTSLFNNLKPPLFSKTASSIDIRLRSNPVEVLCPVP